MLPYVKLCDLGTIEYHQKVRWLCWKKSVPCWW